jgi:hypothetical protein
MCCFRCAHQALPTVPCITNSNHFKVKEKMRTVLYEYIHFGVKEKKFNKDQQQAWSLMARFVPIKIFFGQPLHSLRGDFHVRVSQ